MRPSADLIHALARAAEDKEFGRRFLLERTPFLDEMGFSVQPPERELLDSLAEPDLTKFFGRLGDPRTISSKGLEAVLIKASMDKDFLIRMETDLDGVLADLRPLLEDEETAVLRSFSPRQFRNIAGLYRNRAGQSWPEYLAIGALIVFIALVALTASGGSISNMFGHISGTLGHRVGNVDVKLPEKHPPLPTPPISSETATPTVTSDPPKD